MRAIPESESPRVLRIAVVTDGRIVEERLMKSRVPIRVGTSEKNDVVIASSLLPSSFELFTPFAGAYHLNLVEGMDGRVGTSTGVLAFDELWRAAKPSRTGRELRLDETARGKLVLGPTTLLFQLVPPPPVVAPPQLPRGAIDAFGSRIDWTLTVIAACSFLAHFGAVGSLYGDWGDRVTQDEANVGGLVERLPAPAPPKVVEPVRPDAPSKGDAADGKTAANTPTTSGRKGDAKAGPRAPARDPHAGWIAALDRMNAGTIGVFDGGPATQRVLLGGDLPTGLLGDLAKRDVGVSPGGPDGLRVGPADTGVDTSGKRSITDLVGPGGKPIGTDSGKAGTVAPPLARVDPGPAVPKGKVTGFEGALQGARGRIRACYQASVSNDPTVEGRIAFTIMVGPGGAVKGVSASASGNLPASVVGCVQGVLRGLRFDSEGEASVSGSFTFVNANKGK